MNIGFLLIYHCTRKFNDFIDKEQKNEEERKRRLEEFCKRKKKKFEDIVQIQWKYRRNGVGIA